MDIRNQKNGPYFDGVDLSRVADGDWFTCDGGPQSLTLTAELALVGAGTIGGELWGEFTADTGHQRGVTRLTMPEDCFHGSSPTVGLNYGEQGWGVLLTAAPSGAFGLSFSFPVCGSMRFRYNPTSIAGLVAGGVSRLTMDVRISRP